MKLYLKFGLLLLLVVGVDQLLLRDSGPVWEGYFAAKNALRWRMSPCEAADHVWRAATARPAYGDPISSAACHRPRAS